MLRRDCFQAKLRLLAETLLTRHWLDSIAHALESHKVAQYADDTTGAQTAYTAVSENSRAVEQSLAKRCTVTFSAYLTGCNNPACIYVRLPLVARNGSQFVRRAKMLGLGRWLYAVVRCLARRIVAMAANAPAGRWSRCVSAQLTRADSGTQALKAKLIYHHRHALEPNGLMKLHIRTIASSRPFVGSFYR